MRFLLLFLLITAFSTLGNECGGRNERRCVVSVINLVATPSQYHEKEVLVKGYINTSSGGVWLSLFNGDFDPASMVYIDLHDEFVDSMSLKNQGFYMVAGVFESCGVKQASSKECYNSIVPIVGDNGEPIIVSMEFR